MLLAATQSQIFVVPLALVSTAEHAVVAVSF